HESQDITQMTSRGVNAPAQRALNHRMACARVRSWSGNQIMKALVRFGKQPASPAPKKNRAMIREARFQTYPVAAVKTDHRITTRSNTLRGPIRSPSQPPGISKSAYAQANAENAKPIWPAVRPSSSCMKGAAWEMHTRSTYVIIASVTAKRRTPSRTSLRLVKVSIGSFKFGPCPDL